MPVTRYPVIDDSIIRSLCEVLGSTEGGLTNKQINEFAGGDAHPRRDPAGAARHLRDGLEA